MKKSVVIGLGGMGLWHAKSLQNCEGFVLGGVYDINPERKKTAKEIGTYFYHSLEEVLSDKTVDLITVATPNDVHKEIVIKCLQAGKNVACEKPVTICLDDLNEMIEAAKKANKLLTVHQNRRWDGDFLAVKDIIEKKKIGKVISIESRVHGSRGIPGDWRSKKAQGGGMMLDWGVHLIDQLCQIIKEPIVSVYAHFDHITNDEVDDGFKMDMVAQSGLVASVEVSTRSFVPLPRWYVRGTEATLLMPDFNSGGSYVSYEKLNEEDVKPVILGAGASKTMAPRLSDTQTTLVENVPSNVQEFYKNIANVLDGKEALLIRLDEVTRVMRLMEAAFVSAHTNQIVPFQDSYGEPTLLVRAGVNASGLKLQRMY